LAQDLFPDRGHDGEEPVGSGPWPAGGTGPADDGAADAGASLEQGLFVCLPAEELSLAGFAQDGRADTMAPGPLLAEVVHAVTGEDGAGLAALGDDQLIGIISAARRMESRAAWTLMAALRELARRRPPSGEPGDTGRAGVSDFACDEVADELNLTWQSAAEQIAYACQVADRLPCSFAALAAGRIHSVHLRIIEDETRVLSPGDAAKADEVLAAAAPSMTFGKLRYAAHRLVLKLDADAALRRKEAARKDAYVSRFREDSGNAGMIARELPPDEILASWQHIEQRALDLRVAGVPGTLQELRVKAYLDLLQERDSRSAPGDPGAGGTAEDGAPGGSNGPGCRENNGPGRTGSTRQDTSPSVAALVNITVTLSTLVGRSGAPGEAAGFGLLDADDARDLVTAAARHPATRWCITALHPDGTAAAHGCVVGRGRPPPLGTEPRDYLASLRIRLAPIARGRCNHERAEPGYRPSRTLQHLIKVRNARCTAPGCNRPAARCDLDHTVAWDQGGITCECGLAPLCRHHHRCKQAEGWQLEQPEPGVLVWRTPAGRSYAVAPTEYLV
jgi:Domain of unknown function (DUF222)